MDTLSSPTDERKEKRTRLLGRFVQERDGSTAIEFAVLAIPFSLLVFAILECCISFAAQEVMTNATDSVARQFRTGQIKAADASSTQVKNLICAKLEIMVAKGCPGLEVDLRTKPTFAELANAKFTIQNKKIVLLTNGAAESGGYKFQPGLSTQKSMLRVFYKWPVMTDFMAKSMANLENGATLHFASATWQNEPF